MLHRRLKLSSRVMHVCPTLIRNRLPFFSAMPENDIPNLMTANQVARLTNSCPSTVARKIRGRVSPVAFLVMASREPSALYDEKYLLRIKGILTTIVLNM